MKRLLILIVLSCAARAWALAPDELLLLVNSTNPASQRCAEFYAKARLVPDGRILALKLPNNDDISFEQYERDVVPPIRKFLRQNNLAEKVKCIVTFYGVPLRIAGHKPTASEQQELGVIRQLFNETAEKTAATVDEAEKFAHQIDPSFQSAGEGGMETFAPRAAAALGAVMHALGPTEHGISKANAQRLLRFVSKLTGDAELFRQFSDEDFDRLASTTDEAQHWKSRRPDVQQTQHIISSLEEQRFDADARKKTRELVTDCYGLFGMLNLLRSQQEYLSNDGSVAAFDSELAALWWNYYPRAGSVPNMLHHRFRNEKILPEMMVMRLDGPQEAIVDNIILTSLRAERDGLKGKFAIDATGGLGLDGKPDARGGYAAFDSTLTHLATLVRAYTKLPLTLDTKHTLFPPNSVKDVALYAGWYSVRHYIPFATFKPGAIAVHIASYECVSLHMEGEQGWCANLLNDGVAATMGAVAEPYLDAFPLPDEFFPLIMTGKVTLAEAYWSTVPQVSWMMTCIGDPLYVPFKTNPAMRVEDLPDSVKGLFVKNATTQPARDPLGPEPGQEKPHGQGQVGFHL